MSATVQWELFHETYGGYDRRLETGETVQTCPVVRIESDKNIKRVVCPMCGIVADGLNQFGRADRTGTAIDTAISHSDMHYKAFMVDHPFPPFTGVTTCPCERREGRTGLCDVCAR